MLFFLVILLFPTSGTEAKVLLSALLGAGCMILGLCNRFPPRVSVPSCIKWVGWTGIGCFHAGLHCEDGEGEKSEEEVFFQLPYVVLWLKP